MSLTIILSLTPGGATDVEWTLTADQEAEFLARLDAAPIPGAAPGAGNPRGYAGFIVRGGGGETWTIFRGWIRRGLNTRADERRVLEQWLLDTGADHVPARLHADLTRQITPPSREEPA
jgi:hypothetical protein